jgi:hypothetical protein
MCGDANKIRKVLFDKNAYKTKKFMRGRSMIQFS